MKRILELLWALFGFGKKIKEPVKDPEPETPTPAKPKPVIGDDHLSDVEIHFPGSRRMNRFDFDDLVRTPINVRDVYLCASGDVYWAQPDNFEKGKHTFIVVAWDRQGKFLTDAMAGHGRSGVIKGRVNPKLYGYLGVFWFSDGEAATKMIGRSEIRKV